MTDAQTNPGATRQRKILIAAASLVVGALVFDRLILGTGMSGPEDASAADPVSSAINATASGIPSGPSYLGVAQDLPRLPTVADSLAARLQELAAREGLDPDQIQDSFTPRGMWAVDEPEDVPIITVEQGALPSNLRLDATMVNATGGHALINGRLVAVGAAIGGYTLTAVSSDSATFVDPTGNEFVVRLQTGKGLRDGDKVNVGSENSSDDGNDEGDPESL